MNGGTVARIGAAVLTERGIATLISLILIGAFLWLGWQLVSDMKAFQQQMLLEAARTNEQLHQLQLTHAEMTIKMDRIERLLIEKSGP